jgi:DNA primase
MIPKSFVQDLLSRVDIVDVVESYVPLKRAGSNLTACCPFHSEKTPSFTVSPSKQFYHCFGCSAHGSAIGFLMEYSGLSFVEAVKDLAARVGMKVPEAVPPRAARASEQATAPEALAELLSRVAQYYKSELKRSSTAIDYLKSRGLTGEIAARFGLGYAPSGWQNLSAVVSDYAAPSLVDAGLVVQGEAAKRYDRFRDRIMFPIVNQRGQIVGFGGRVLDRSEPKYLNSPETSLFEKGRELYGLFQARQAVRTAGCAIVVEGYMDVLALAQCGVEHAVATLGTATTPWHLRKLMRQTDEVVFCFDGDAAGRRAAWRALEGSLEHLQDGKQVKFLFLPPEHDPDSFVRAEGREAFEQRVREALPLTSFALKELAERVDLGTPEGRAKFLQDAKPLVKRINAPMLSLMLVKRVAELAGASQAEVEERFELRAPRRGAAAPPRVVRRSLDPYARLLARVLAEPSVLDELSGAELPVGLNPSVEAAALLALTERLSTGGAVPPNGAAAEEWLRMSGHGAAVEASASAIADLGGFNAEELRVEVREAVRSLQEQARRTEAHAHLAGLESPREVTPEARVRLSRALSAGRAVEKH